MCPATTAEAPEVPWGAQLGVKTANPERGTADTTTARQPSHNLN